VCLPVKEAEKYTTINLSGKAKIELILNFLDKILTTWQIKLGKKIFRRHNTAKMFFKCV
jgi:hypothetical protein